MKIIRLRNFNIKKALIYIYVLNIMQVAIAVFLLLFKAKADDSKVNNIEILIFTVIIFVVINSAITLYDKYSIRKVHIEYDSLSDTLKQVEHLNNTLKAQRHDFLNHLQIVYSLMEMSEYEEAGGYIEKVFSDIQKVSRFLKTAKPAINALLQAKINYCEKKGIVVKLKVSSPLNSLLIPEWELGRILGNLIDNAIFVLDNEQQKNEKLILIEISEDLNFHTIKIADNGKTIPKEILEKIFEPGFSTKGSKGQGMGLYIVKELVANYKGLISLKSSDNETTFIISLPKDNQANLNII